MIPERKRDVKAAEKDEFEADASQKKQSINSRIRAADLFGLTPGQKRKKLEEE